jgi:hypothetical protein
LQRNLLLGLPSKELRAQLAAFVLELSSFQQFQGKEKKKKKERKVLRLFVMLYSQEDIINVE